jgi:hypothetical protein
LARVKKRRLLVAAYAALALALACVTGELRSSAIGDTGSDGDSDVASAADLVDALPPVASLALVPLPSAAGVFVDLHIPPSRMTTAEVFRPPQARS